MKLAVLDSDRYTDAGKALTIEKREQSFAQSRETQRRENISRSKIEAWSRCNVSEDEFNQRKSNNNRQRINIHQLYEVTAGVMNDQQEWV